MIYKTLYSENDILQALKQYIVVQHIKNYQYFCSNQYILHNNRKHHFIKLSHEFGVNTIKFNNTVIKFGIKEKINAIKNAHQQLQITTYCPTLTINNPHQCSIPLYDIKQKNIFNIIFTYFYVYYILCYYKLYFDDICNDNFIITKDEHILIIDLNFSIIPIYNFIFNYIRFSLPIGITKKIIQKIFKLPSPKCLTNI